MIIAIDPGIDTHGYVMMSGPRRVIGASISGTRHVLDLLFVGSFEHVIVESPEPRGMPTSLEEMRMLETIGMIRVATGWPDHDIERVTRRQVKLTLCGTLKGVTDANVTAALHSRWGGSRRAAVGVKAEPGPLYGFKSHMWAALAVAETWFELSARPQGARDGEALRAG